MERKNEDNYSKSILQKTPKIDLENLKKNTVLKNSTEQSFQLLTTMFFFETPLVFKGVAHGCTFMHIDVHSWPLKTSLNIKNTKHYALCKVGR